MLGDPLLDVEHLTVCFRNDGDETVAVDNISFQLGKHEILGIVGESGSGKSVTALSILGLISDPPGTVTVEAIRLAGSFGQMIRMTWRACSLTQDPSSTVWASWHARCRPTLREWISC